MNEDFTRVTVSGEDFPVNQWKMGTARLWVLGKNRGEGGEMG